MPKQDFVSEDLCSCRDGLCDSFTACIMSILVVTIALDWHAGNVFALRDGRIAYVDFGNVAELSQSNKQVLIDAVVHAVNEDYYEMATDFVKLVRSSQACSC